MPIHIMTAFTASGTLATDLQGAKLVALFPGIPLPLPSANVQDTAGNQTLDLTLAAIKAQQAKTVANVAAINAQLGTAKVTGFPLTLQ